MRRIKMNELKKIIRRVEEQLKQREIENRKKGIYVTYLTVENTNYLLEKILERTQKNGKTNIFNRMFKRQRDTEDDNPIKTKI